MNPDRRDFLALGVGALAVGALPAMLRRRPRLVSRRLPVMGTVAEVVVRHRDSAWALRAIDAAFAELRRVDATMTRFRSDSDIGRVNLAAGSRSAVSEDTGLVLRAALGWAQASEGRFDPCLGGATALWDVAQRDRPPLDPDVARFAGRGLWQSLEVEVGGTSPTVRLHRPDAALDLGGIAKGFGVDAAARALRDHGVFHALVNVGGDLAALGVDHDDEPWRIGVRSPYDPDEVIEVLRVSDAAVATSGDYLQYFQHGGRRYHHLLDPETGEPRRTRARSLTAQADRCMTADAAATTLFGATPAVAAGILHRAASTARIVHQVEVAP